MVANGKAPEVLAATAAQKADAYLGPSPFAPAAA